MTLHLSSFVSFEQDKGSSFQRPSIPALFFIAAALWVTCAASYTAGEHISLSVLHLGVVVGAIGAGLSLITGWRLHFPNIICGMLGVFLGLCCGCMAALGLHKAQEEALQCPFQDYTFTVIEDPAAGDFDTSCLARTTLPSGTTCVVKLQGQDLQKIMCWDRLQASCVIDPPSKTAASSYWRKACVGRARIYSYEMVQPHGVLAFLGSIRKAGLARFFESPYEGALLIQSISFGYRSKLFSSRMYGKVKAAGLAHLVAVSGAHLSVVSAGIALLLRLLRFPLRVLAVAQITLIVLFAVCVGAPPSALRAATMASCAIVSLLVQRRAHALSALALCIMVFLVVYPSTAVSVSFALSALTTCSIVIFTPLISSWIFAALGNRFSLLADSIGMTFSAVFASLPFSMAVFHQLSLMTVLSNILLLPMFGVLCIGGMVAAFLHPAPVLGSWLFSSIIALAELFCRIISLVAQFPYASIPVTASFLLICSIEGLLAVLAYHAWPKLSTWGARIAGAFVASLMLLALCIAPQLIGSEVIALDVGQGDAIVLRNGAHAVLIDTGNKDSDVLAGLARHGVFSLDAILISHSDDDHCGSLDTLLDAMQVGAVGIAADALACTCNNCTALRETIGDVPIYALHQDDVMSWGTFHMDVVAPACYNYQGGNEDSLILVAACDSNRDGTEDARILLTGDAESERLNTLHRTKGLQTCDIYKVAHHGSRDEQLEAALTWMRPSIALVSVGADNRYGHPNTDTLDVLEQAGVHIFRTDTQGDIVCKLLESRIEVVV